MLDCNKNRCVVAGIRFLLFQLQKDVQELPRPEDVPEVHQLDRYETSSLQLECVLEWAYQHGMSCHSGTDCTPIEPRAAA